MSSFKERLQLLWGDAKPAQIARDLNWSISGVLRILEKDTIPKAETLVSIQKLKGCDWNWLMTGEGIPFPKGAPSGSGQELQEAAGGYNARWISQSTRSASEVRDTLGNPVDLSEFVFIPRYNVRASAGNGFPVGNEEPLFPMAFRRSWVEHYLNANPADLSVIKVRGDSMEPVLCNNDNILVNHAKRQPSNGLFVVRIGGELVVKYTQIMPGGKLLLKSTNEIYDPFELDLAEPDADVEIIGRVEWFGRQV